MIIASSTARMIPLKKQNYDKFDKAAPPLLERDQSGRAARCQRMSAGGCVFFMVKAGTVMYDKTLRQGGRGLCGGPCIPTMELWASDYGMRRRGQG
jgi:hypothetical protein